MAPLASEAADAGARNDCARANRDRPGAFFILLLRRHAEQETFTQRATYWLTASSSEIGKVFTFTNSAFSIRHTPNADRTWPLSVKSSEPDAPS